jgi:hypothetical protein
VSLRARIESEGATHVERVCIGVARGILPDVQRGMPCRGFRLAPMASNRGGFTHELVVHGFSKGQVLVPLPMEHLSGVRAWVAEGAAGACPDERQRFGLVIAEHELGRVGADEMGLV